MKSLSFVIFFFVITSLALGRSNVDLIYTSPQPNAVNCSLYETIILSVFEDINLSTLDNSQINVIGSTSGFHKGSFYVALDKQTIIFKSFTPFEYSETVNVILGTGIRTLSDKAIKPKNYNFIIRNQRSKNDFVNLNSFETRIPYSKVDFKIFNNNFDHTPNSEPTAYVTTSLNPSYGRIYISGFRSDTVSYNPYLTIYDNSGSLVTSKSIQGPGVDFKKQINDTYSYCSLAKNIFYILDSNLNQIDSVMCGNGYTTDLHELIIMDNGNMLIMSYDSVEIDMSQIVDGGNPNALVAGLVIQELDKNKNVVFQWRSWEEMEITDASHQDFTAAKIDYVHGNSIEPDYDGNFIISSRHLDEVTKINRKTGKIMWRLGGKKNQFTFINDDLKFSYQHDARRVAPGRITIFDNGNFHSPPFSRAIEYELDEVNLTAKLVWQ